jgi:hypothetical protein
MKSVKLAARSGVILPLFSVLTATALFGCTAEVGPSEPTTEVARTPTDPGKAAAGNTGNEHAVGTSTARNGFAHTIGEPEPLPNPWHPPPDNGLPSSGGVPAVSTPAGPPPATNVRRNDVEDRPDPEDRYDAPPATHHH